MKIIIDIPEYVFKICQGHKDIVYQYIANGKPLQKNHGDLIDRTEVIKSLFDYHNGKKTIGQCIDDVPTTIEADKR